MNKPLITKETLKKMTFKNINLKNIKTKSIKLRIISIILTFTFFITLFTVSICFLSFQSLLSNSLVTSTKFNLQLVSKSISSDMESILAFSNWCNNKNVISSYLSSTSEDQRAISLSAWKQLREELVNNPSASYINRIVIGSDKGKYLHTTSSTSLNAFNMVEVITSLPYFDELYNSSEAKWVGLVFNPFSDNEKEQMIPVIRPIYSPYNNDKIGFSYISVSTNLFTHTLNNYSIPSDSMLFLTINDQTYRITDHTLVQVTPQHDLNAATDKGSYYVNSIVDENGKDHTLITVRSSIDGWYLSQTLSEHEFAQQKKVYILLIVFICTVLLSLGFSLAIYLNHIINQPLDKITHKISLISSGDFTYEPEIEWDNELGDIGKGINELSEAVVTLMDNRIKTEKEKKELEYQILQSQINPHFLYNTLNSIKWMATIQQATGIAEMTTALSRLMRAVSKDTQQIVSLRDEISLLDNYFLIQKYRYGGTLNLDYVIEDETLYDCQILKFTLQPMVENAIFHGIEPKGEAGHIMIQVRQLEEDTLLIQITDNGVGMTPEQVQQFHSGTTSSNPEFFKKIGVSNVRSRIQYTFGMQYGVNVTSEPMKYTVISIKLPYINPKNN